ncbi:hypothetical protein [Nocardia nepalensis]
MNSAASSYRDDIVTELLPALAGVHRHQGAAVGVHAHPGTGLAIPWLRR